MRHVSPQCFVFGFKIVRGALEIFPALYPEVFVYPGFKKVAGILEILPTICPGLLILVIHHGFKKVAPISRGVTSTNAAILGQTHS